ncbi:MAG: FdhD protein, partial [Bermanella sp.]
MAITNLQEAAIAVCINGVCQSVMMASPTDLEAFGLGFILCEGIIENTDAVLAIDCDQQSNGWQVDITVIAASEHSLKQRRRLMAGPSGCGLCGVASLDEAMALPLNTKAELGAQPLMNAVNQGPLIKAAISQISHLQHQFACTRGHHSAMFFDKDGAFIDLAEDVGRHSALDKLIGRLARNPRKPVVLATGFAVLTSRCSHDLVIKASRTGIAALVTLGLPTDLAV